MNERVVVLGAGFGGLELSTMLAEASGGEIEVTLIDKSDSFVFGFSKLDLMFGRETAEAVRMPYGEIAKPGVRVLRETVTAIDPEARRVTTDAGVRDACRISFVIPLPTPVPPSPEASAALEEEFAERGIELVAGRRIGAIDPDRSVAILDDGSELPFDLFLGVPKHRAPDVVIASGMTEDGYVPVDPATLATRLPGVYAVGDVATAGVPKAGVFAEGAARIVAQALIAEFRGGEPPGRHLGQGTCYIEFGGGRVGSVDIDFLSGPSRSGSFNMPSTDLVAAKLRFGSSRRQRWFGVEESA